jgi:hypothetical protein
MSAGLNGHTRASTSHHGDTKMNKLTDIFWALVGLALVMSLNRRAAAQHGSEVRVAGLNIKRSASHATGVRS